MVDMVSLVFFFNRPLYLPPVWKVFCLARRVLQMIGAYANYAANMITLSKKGKLWVMP